MDAVRYGCGGKEDPDDALTALMRPRVKPEHEAYRLSDSRIRIGGAVYGPASEIVDDSGVVWALLRALDGSRRVDEVVAAVVAEFPDQDPQTVTAGIATLTRAGFIEDTAVEAPHTLSERERQRYDRSRMYYRWVDTTGNVDTWRPQVALRTASVLVIGVGGTGGVAATALAASGVGRLHLVDCDTVELSNLNRQTLFREADVGLPKHQAAAAALRALNSDIEISSEHARITGAGDIAKLLPDHDLLVLAADTPGEIRAWANSACLDVNLAWVESGYHGPQVAVGIFRPGTGTGCYECIWLAEHERGRAKGSDRAYTVQRGGKNAVAAPSAGLSGYYAAHYALALITGIPAITGGQLRAMNLVDSAHTFVIDDPKRDDCPACGTRPR